MVGSSGLYPKKLVKSSPNSSLNCRAASSFVMYLVDFTYAVASRIF